MQSTSEQISLTVADGTTMGAYLARPAGGGPHRGILVLQEAFGVNAHIRDVTDRFAREGYVALAPELFHRTASGFEGSYDDFTATRPHLQALTNEGLAADLRAAYERLHGDPAVDAGRIASIGFCMGGRVSFLANAVLPLQAAISFYGGGIAPGLLNRAADLHAPALLFWGGLDTHIPPEQRRSVADALTAAGKSFTYVEFSQAGHGFFNDVRPAYQPQAARQAWALSLAFLDTTLG